MIILYDRIYHIDFIYKYYRNNNYVIAYNSYRYIYMRLHTHICLCKFFHNNL